MIYAVSTIESPMNAASISDCYTTEFDAQEAVKRLAERNQGTTYYVHAFIDSVITFKATARVQMETEYVHAASE